MYRCVKPSNLPPSYEQAIGLQVSASDQIGSRPIESMSSRSTAGMFYHPAESNAAFNKRLEAQSNHCPNNHRSNVNSQRSPSLSAPPPIAAYRVRMFFLNPHDISH